MVRPTKAPPVIASILRALVGMNERLLGSTAPHGHHDGIEDQLAGDRRLRRPPDNLAGGPKKGTGYFSGEGLWGWTRGRRVAWRPGEKWFLTPFPVQEKRGSSACPLFGSDRARKSSLSPFRVQEKVACPLFGSLFGSRADERAARGRSG
jgi:hypothetical protein